jgi:hypothetical protein
MLSFCLKCVLKPATEFWPILLFHTKCLHEAFSIFPSPLLLEYTLCISALEHLHILMIWIPSSHGTVNSLKIEIESLCSKYTKTYSFICQSIYVLCLMSYVSDCTSFSLSFFLHAYLRYFQNMASSWSIITNAYRINVWICWIFIGAEGRTSQAMGGRGVS